MKVFKKLLGIAMLVTTTNNFVWFALTYWLYLETRSVVSTSVAGGIFLVTNAMSSFWMGSLVDHYKKKYVMWAASVASLALYGVGFGVLNLNDPSVFASVGSPTMWLFVVLLLAGVLAGSIYNIAVPTLIGSLIPEDQRDRANGMFGTVMGLAFGITSVASGLVLGFGGMHTVLMVALVLTLMSIIVWNFVDLEEKQIVKHEHHQHGKLDIKGTIKTISNIPGLFGLIFFTTFNNFLGGVFMALMDAYGLSLVSVQVWGMLWGALSFAFILGGILIAKRGLGRNPIRTLLRVNMITWTVCIFFTIQPSIVLLAVGAFIWMVLVPYVEAIEQTIVQKVVPAERQGRVFGFAHSVEQAASPLTSFMIGPIAQYVFIPFMTTGAGVDLIGGWFGVGIGRGIALVFTIAGMIGLAMTLLATKSRPYKLLSGLYK